MPVRNRILDGSCNIWMALIEARTQHHFRHDVYRALLGIYAMVA